MSKPGQHAAPAAQVRAWCRPRAGCSVIRVWSGVEGYSGDAVPVMGPSRASPSACYYAFGFCGDGFQIGPASAT